MGFLEELWEAIQDFFAGNGGLQIEVLSGPRNLTDCGAAEWVVKWSLRDMTRTGWVIQHVTFTFQVTDCNGRPRASTVPDLEYWEGWQVQGGKVWGGFAALGLEPGTDTFRTVDEGNGTKGRTVVRGRVRFIEDFNLTIPPWGFTVPAAGILPTITPPAEPEGWSDVGADAHDLIVTWECCDGDQEQGTSTELGPNLIQRFLGRIRRILGLLGQARAGAPSVEREIVNEDVVDQLDPIPAWCDTPAADADTRQQIVRALSAFNGQDDDALRQLIADYVVAKARSENGYDVAAMSRLYVLNRILFEVPDRVSLGELSTPKEASAVQVARFGGFAGIPQAGDVVDELWPLSMDASGELQLTGTFAGYFGAPYQAVAEFDRFAELYPRRT